MSLSQSDILDALRQVQEPELHKDLVSLNMIRDLTLEGDRVGFTLTSLLEPCSLLLPELSEVDCSVAIILGVRLENHSLDFGDQTIRDTLRCAQFFDELLGY